MRLRSPIPRSIRCSRRIVPKVRASACRRSRSPRLAVTGASACWVHAPSRTTRPTTPAAVNLGAIPTFNGYSRRVGSRGSPDPGGSRHWLLARWLHDQQLEGAFARPDQDLPVDHADLARGNVKVVAAAGQNPQASLTESQHRPGPGSQRPDSAGPGQAPRSARIQRPGRPWSVSGHRSRRRSGWGVADRVPSTQPERCSTSSSAPSGGQPGRQCPGGLVAADHGGPGGDHRAGVEARVELHQRHPGFLVPRQHGSDDRARPSPSRQEREMDVEKAPAGRVQGLGC